MSFLNTTAHLHHRTLLPPTATLASANSIFRNHDTLIRLDPDLASYDTIPPPPDAADDKTKYYKITDVMHTLPRGLWDTNVSFTAEITDVENGVKWVIKAPLGLVQTSVWNVQPAGEQDGVGDKEERLVLVEDVEIKCSRLLIGTVSGKCEENWRGVHGRWVEHLEKLDG